MSDFSFLIDRAIKFQCLIWNYNHFGWLLLPMKFIRVILEIQREVFTEAPFKKKKVGSLFGHCSHSFWPLSSVHFGTLDYQQTILASIFMPKLTNRFSTRVLHLFRNIHQKKCIRGVHLFRNTHRPLSPSSLYVCLCSGRGVLFSVMACCDTPLLSRITRPALICIQLIITLTPIVWLSLSKRWYILGICHSECVFLAKCSCPLLSRHLCSTTWAEE